MAILVKTAAELEIMRHSGKILQAAQTAMKKALVPGISLKEINTIAEDVIRTAGGKPGFLGFHGFPATICGMINSEVVHGIPDDRKLKKGDLVSVDCGVIWKNLFSDAAFSVIIGGEETHPERAKFSKTVRSALLSGCDAARAGNHIGDIGHAIETVVRRGGYSICKEYTGHGLGYEMHEEPYIFNYGRPGHGAKLRAGMTIAIEPIIAAGRPTCKILKDGWTVVTADGHDSCQWEHCGVVTETGLEIFA
ncbi:type I methionyl aminopeptidase [bacterium]|jgi:methionyl aminopeptidase|nr:type I methionyl aminopeptidase [bacterium]MBT6832337.1 type I methionyl aminopeptidase [bacterium]MBT6996432.1 type I methionyl aminopeptidase [bacterium]MBT7772743.1 type I methionyl aminopeptidase [bacterium]